MRPAELLSLVYFLSLAVAAVALSRRRARWLVALGWAGAGSAVACTAPLSPAMLRDWWLLVALPMAYWAPAPLTTTANARLERWLLAVDDRLGLARRGSTAGRLLELAYLMVYPIVPAGLLAVLASRPEFAADYWLALLLAVLPCYGLLPLLPTRPPRALLLPATSAVATSARRANIRFLATFGNSWNTLPSGHAAGAAAVAVMVARSGSPWAPMFLLLALGIALGTVRGRYHYAVDTILGVALGALAALSV